MNIDQPNKVSGNSQSNHPLVGRHERDALSSVLRQWKVDSELTPRFSERVWLAIQKEQSHEPLETSWLSRFALWVQQAIRRPAYAAVYLAVLVFIGLASGFSKGSADKLRVEELGRARYLQLVDPYDAHAPQ